MKETINIEEAYKDKVERIYHPERYRKSKLAKERRKKGLCIICGRKQITRYQKKEGILSCFRCRKKMEKWKENNAR